MSVIHMSVLRPKLAKDYKKHYEEPVQEEARATSRGSVVTPTKQEAQVAELGIEQQGRRLMNMLRWESVLGIAVLLCTGLLTVFSGTLVPVTGQQQSVQSAPTASSTQLQKRLRQPISNLQLPLTSILTGLATTSSL